MYQELTPQQAVNWAIQARHDAWAFYCRAADLADDVEGQRVFAHLAARERELAQGFFALCAGPDHAFDAYFDALPTEESAVVHALRQRLTAGMGAQRALEVALEELSAMLQSQQQAAERIIDPAARAYVDRMIADTATLYQGVEAEYARRMGMVAASDMDTFVRE